MSITRSNNAIQRNYLFAATYHEIPTIHTSEPTHARRPDLTCTYPRSYCSGAPVRSLSVAYAYAMAHARTTQMATKQSGRQSISLPPLTLNLFKYVRPHAEKYAYRYAIAHARTTHSDGNQSIGAAIHFLPPLTLNPFKYVTINPNNIGPTLNMHGANHSGDSASPHPRGLIAC